MAIGATGVASANDVRGIRWQFDDGHVEDLGPEEFDRRSDTPPLSEVVGGPAGTPDCCGCPGIDIDCVHCFVLRCDDDDEFGEIQAE